MDDREESTPDISDLIARIRPLDETAMRAAQARQDILTKPRGSLGRLEELSIQLAGITRRCPPPVPTRKGVLVFAGDHGVVAQGVSAYPREVTPQMVYNFLRGGAAINVLARCAGARVVIVDAGVAVQMAPADGLVPGKIAPGTADMSLGPAMTREQAMASIALGARVAEREIDTGLDLLACGDMGIGNTTAATAITAVFTGISPLELAGPERAWLPRAWRTKPRSWPERCQSIDPWQPTAWTCWRRSAASRSAPSAARCWRRRPPASPLWWTGSSLLPAR
jgi:nicotinate-nucleotide--dimethylbenzimidazole phosphoribosyltransferase